MPYYPQISRTAPSLLPRKTNALWYREGDSEPLRSLARDTERTFEAKLERLEKATNVPQTFAQKEVKAPPQPNPQPSYQDVDDSDEYTGGSERTDSPDPSEEEFLSDD